MTAGLSRSSARRARWMLLAGLSFLALVAAIVLLTPTQRADAQPRGLATQEMFDLLRDDGSLALSVTYRSAAALPSDGSMSSYLSGLGFERQGVLAGLSIDGLDITTTIPGTARVRSHDLVRGSAAGASRQPGDRHDRASTTDISFEQASDGVLALDEARPALEVELMHSLGFTGAGVNIASSIPESSQPTHG